MLSDKTTSLMDADTHVELQRRALNSVETLIEAVVTSSSSSLASTKKQTRNPSFGPTSKWGKTIHHEVLEYTQHIYKYLSQEKGLEFLEFLHQLQFDILEPHLSNLNTPSALQSLIHTLATIIHTLFINVPEGIYPSSAWQGVWGHCLKSILLITNSLIELPSSDPLSAFQTLASLLIQLLDHKDMFYRIQCEAMNVFVQLLSRSSENKKITRQTYLSSLLTALERVPSVELQFLVIETIYRVLPALRHLRKQTLTAYQLRKEYVDIFIVMDASNFESSSRTLVTLINQHKTAASTNPLDYPATVQLTRIVYREELMHLETPLTDSPTFYLDLTPDALVFSCTFENQPKETIFDLPYENIIKYYLLPHLRQVEFTALRVPKWSSPKEFGQANFFFQVANDASMLCVSQCFHFHCPLESISPKLSKLSTPVKTSSSSSASNPHDDDDDDGHEERLTSSPKEKKEISRVVGYLSSAPTSLAKKRETGLQKTPSSSVTDKRQGIPQGTHPKHMLKTPPDTESKMESGKRIHESESEMERREGEQKGVEADKDTTKQGDTTSFEPPTTPTPMVSSVSGQPSSPLMGLRHSPSKKKRKPNTHVTSPSIKATDTNSTMSASVVPGFLYSTSPSKATSSTSTSLRHTSHYPTPLSTTADHVQQQMKKLQDRLAQLEQAPNAFATTTNTASTARNAATHFPYPPLSTTTTASATAASTHHATTPLTASTPTGAVQDLETWGESFGRYLSHRFQHQDQVVHQLHARQQVFEQQTQHRLQERLEQVCAMLDMKTKAMEDTVQRELQMVRQVMQGAEHVLEKTISVIGRSHQDSVRALEELHGQMTSTYPAGRPPFSAL